MPDPCRISYIFGRTRRLKIEIKTRSEAFFRISGFGMRGNRVGYLTNRRQLLVFQRRRRRLDRQFVADDLFATICLRRFVAEGVIHVTTRPRRDWRLRQIDACSPVGIDWNYRHCPAKSCRTVRKWRVCLQKRD